MKPEVKVDNLPKSSKISVSSRRSTPLDNSSISSRHSRNSVVRSRKRSFENRRSSRKRKKTVRSASGNFPSFISSQSKSEVSFITSRSEDTSSYKDNQEADEDIGERPPILALPLKIRVWIWKRVTGPAFLALRAVCHRVKIDIDNFVGVIAVIRQFHRSYNFLKRIGIRTAIISNLVEKINLPMENFLLYPDLLEELCITGPISDSYFAYIMESCLNIFHLEIDFSKRLLVLKPEFFPTSNPANQLTRVRRVIIKSESRFDMELICIRQNLIGLFTQNLTRNPIWNFHIHLVHSEPSPALRDCHQTLSHFVNSKAFSLITIFLTIKIKRKDIPVWSVSEFDLSLGEPVTKTAQSNDLDNSHIVESEECNEELTTNESMRCKISLPTVNWMKFERTTELHLSINGIHANTWKDFPLEMKILESVYLDLPLPGGNWHIYRSTITNCGKTLTKVQLIDVDNGGTSDDPREAQKEVQVMDVGVFRICKKLKFLTFKCKETEVGTICRMETIRGLSKSLIHLNLCWMTLSPYQLIRLVVFYKKMESLQVQYWSKSTSTFRRFLCLLKLAHKFHMVKVPLIKIVDHKVRFQTAINDVRVVIRALGPKAKYIDHDQTMIVIDSTVLQK